VKNNPFQLLLWLTVVAVVVLLAPYFRVHIVTQAPAPPAETSDITILSKPLESNRGPEIEHNEGTQSSDKNTESLEEIQGMLGE
jgi:hypothetical protein